MNVTENNVLDDIRKMLSETYPTVDISMDTYLEFGNGSHLDMSSLEIVQFIIDLEEKYGIIVDIDERFITVGDAIRSVLTHFNEKTRDKWENVNEVEL